MEQLQIIALLNIFRNNPRHFGDCFMYNRYFITFLSNPQSIFLPTKDKKQDRHLTLLILTLSHRDTSQFIAAVLNSHPSIITNFHTEPFNPNLFMNESIEATVPSPSGESSYTLQPASNSTTLHFSSSMIQMLMAFALKLYGEAPTVIPNSIPCLSKYFFN